MKGLNFIGPSLKAGKLPAVFYFALTAKESLQTSPYNLPATHLADKATRVFSLTLPHHSQELPEKEAMARWGSDMEKGNPLLEPLLDSFSQTLQFLKEEDLASEIAVSGLSRGGFAALHLAARHEEVKTVLGFAPLTSLANSQSFKHLPKETLAPYELDRLIPNLKKKRVRFYIGNQDTRVSTRACFDLMEKVSKEAGRSSTIEMIISPSIGHQGHGTSPETFLDGANWLYEILNRNPL